MVLSYGFAMVKFVLMLGFAVLVVGAAAWAFTASGIYNVAADVPHTKPVHALLETLRERSIARHADAVDVPDLQVAELIRQGSGNYDAMCVGCHLAPGMGATELSKGLSPTPPNLATTSARDPAQAFWVIKHGIKATGMPAWGKSMDDQYIWGMVAFLQRLPKLDAQGYRLMVASSAGHSHGGGESIEHEHADPAVSGATPSSGEVPSEATQVHKHADGSTHVHAPKPRPAIGTDHQH